HADRTLLLRALSTIRLAAGVAAWWLASTLLTGDPRFIVHNWPPNWAVGANNGTGSLLQYWLIRDQPVAGSVLQMLFGLGLGGLGLPEPGRRVWILARRPGGGRHARLVPGPSAAGEAARIQPGVHVDPVRTGSGRATESGDGPGAERADSPRLAAGDARLLGCAHGGAIPRHRRGRARAGGVRAAASSVLR